MPRSLTRLLLPSVFGCLALALAVGCGPSAPKLYGVSGTVKYKGEPIKAGAITFRAENGATGGGQIVDGKYDIPASAGLQPGKYKVAIAYPDPKAPKGEEGGGVVVTPNELLPAKYNSKTELTAEIQPQATNEVNFPDLK